MLVKVNFYGVYRDFLDRSGVELDLPQTATIRDLLNELSDVLGRKFRQRVLTEEGELHRYVSMSVDDRLVSSSEIDERLKAEDSARPNVSVLFVPPMFGGM